MARGARLGLSGWRIDPPKRSAGAEGYLIFLLRPAHTPTAAIAKQARLKRTQIFIFRPPSAENTGLLDFLAETGPSAKGHDRNDDKTKAYPDVHIFASHMLKI
jgi:hypothetical protein